MNKTEQNEMTVDELKSIVEESVKASNLAGEVNALREEVAGIGKSMVKTVGERAEKSASFIRALVSSAKGGEMSPEFKTITTDTNSFGYSMPTELADAIHEKKDKIAKIRKYAFVFKMDGKFDLPVEATGVTAYWVTTEADADITESNPTLTKKSLEDFYLASRVRVPYKLMNSSAISIENFVSSLSARGLRNAEETAFVAGDGSDKPTGIRLAGMPSISQASTHYTYEDLIDLIYTVPEQYRANGVLMTSTVGVKILRKLKDLDGLPIFNAENNTILGYPLLECTDIPTNVGSGSDKTEMIFGDLQEYWIKDGESLITEVRTVAGRLQVDVIVYEAVDGVCVNTDAFARQTNVAI